MSSSSSSDPSMNASKNTDGSSSSTTPCGTNNLPQLPRVEVLRCLRCAKAEEVINVGMKNMEEEVGMVRIGYNLWYCKRCAKTVGFEPAKHG
ncbi:hypothetical protein GcM3_199047 [Golovinomyces cichoracearum]|uniref:Uncharacterized protein n=1 Tax=Golovinomyces cichoracearum TaxID=62708 RepID=A0A420HEU6_9PEZI|nr:hypothetical protein GcM3_199047 [Golovinomyces cichoracearum]